MDAKYDQDGEDLNATVRNLRRLSDQPGDLTFRQSIAGGFEKVTDRLNKIDVRLARIEERQVPRTEIASIAKTELKELANKVDTLSKMVWGLAGAAGTGIIALAIAKIFK